MWFLFGSTVSASSLSEGTERVVITDENRYDPSYYQKPEKRYPVSGARTRSAKENQDFEAYMIQSLQQFQTSIDVTAYQITRGQASSAYFQILNNNPSLFYVEGRVEYDFRVGWTLL